MPQVKKELDWTTFKFKIFLICIQSTLIHTQKQFVKIFINFPFQLFYLHWLQKKSLFLISLPRTENLKQKWLSSGIIINSRVLFHPFFFTFICFYPTFFIPISITFYKERKKIFFEKNINISQANEKQQQQGQRQQYKKRGRGMKSFWFHVENIYIF